MTSYSAIDYLLDKANIHDTITKTFLYVDLLRWEDLEKEAFTDNIRVDCTSLFGAGEESAYDDVCFLPLPYILPSHSSPRYRSLLIDLPQSGSIPSPMEAQVTANFSVTLVPKDGEKGLVQNGGRYHSEVSRITPSDGGNPWRISSLKADVVYFLGGKDFYEGSS
ncbi:uncharacterized protein EV420DRAFT_1639937 [Desarmillaria tabescens]|uniref:Uncharacterized protein n=1 Tax=Armillaria tabescens TaxID=1929756 RepID=A0AA39N9Q2_ARMTA|nr:uncharacterized protein EV420DRAFT_1639937 [Desarmillaria tabescens]KAK0461641.1 hypothetical protein EV420DRAFT_1639937 [Desarmillaria tabescens]